MPSFQSILNAAVNDISSHGFDDVSRLEYWTAELRKAARSTGKSMYQVDALLRRGLGSIYTRLIDNGGAIRYHRGVARYTLSMLSAKCRSELDRRIMASAGLIKMNRESSIEKTIQRFVGWCTSVPAGGSDAVNKKKVRDDVKKPLTSLPFVERRVLIDQGHKLTASINEIVATDNGAIALTWRSHWRQAGYNYREDHKERDGKTYLIRGSWAAQKGFVKGDFYDDITAVGEEPFCRCYATYAYSLKDLPEKLITNKGREALQKLKDAK